MSLRRLRAGEWLAAAGGVALPVALALPWYGDETGFESLSVIDLLLVLLALLGLALAVLQATRDAPALPVGAAVLTVAFGAIGVLLVLYRFVDEPGPDALADVRLGAWLGLAAALAVTVGGWLSMAAEYVRGLPPGSEPELRPAPRIGPDAQP
jgi:hypothetical protein